MEVCSKTTPMGMEKSPTPVSVLLRGCLLLKRIRRKCSRTNTSSRKASHLINAVHVDSLVFTCLIPDDVTMEVWEGVEEVNHDRAE